jgi:hypothetical protein
MRGIGSSSLLRSAAACRRRASRIVLAAAFAGLGLGSMAPSAGAVSFKAVCGQPSGPHEMRCFADVVTSSGATPLVSGTPSGYGPADLQSAYNLPSPSSTAGTGETVGIVDAFDDPNAASDLATYRSQFGLKPCTTANGCFSKVNQSGGTSYPASNSSWAQEISLDLDMVSAICPNCHILLVEASSTSDANLAAAVNRAAALGATQISNSYGEPEFSGDVSEQANYNHPGIDVVAAAGDDGYGVSYPAASQYVTAVGGTSLSRAGNARGWTESAWSGTGSGCSAYTPKPAWQTDTGCGRRTVADVSADANPSTGVAVYDTSGSGGWLVFGGTSVATPIIASVAALAGGRATTTPYGSFAYLNTGDFYDVTSGSNGSCGGSYFCTAMPGFDGPTGLGTPDGAAASGPPPPPPPPPPGVSVSPQGNWVGAYGADGYDLAGWNSTSDQSSLPNATLTLNQGTRYRWQAGTTDVRALESADTTTRNAATYYDPNEIRVSLKFATAYAGNLHLYAVDWDAIGRRETISVGGQSVALSADFSQGAWVVFPLSVTAGQTVTITVDRNAGQNAVLSGIFLGEAAASPPPPPPPPPPPSGVGAGVGPVASPQGNWVSSYGTDGYDLAAWNGTSDLTSASSVASVTLNEGTRYRWQAGTSDVRALESADTTTHNAATYYDASEIRMTLTFPSTYTGSLHLYAVDWDAIGRRETITVGDQTVPVSSDFSLGAWVTFPLTMTAGQSITITVDRTAGTNAVLSGIFLGGATPPPPPPPPPPTVGPGTGPVTAPQGSWVGTYGADGYDLAAWNGTSDVVSMPNATVSLAQGTRFRWQAGTSDVRALESASQSTRNAATYYDPNEIRVSVAFTTAYTGVLRLYAMDWDAIGRRETITVGGQSVALSASFSQGAWVSFPITASAGQSVTITVDRTAGQNAVLSGILLGAA